MSKKFLIFATYILNNPQAIIIMANYDVFISCKSEDYPQAEEVYSFLNENHIRAFIASKELRKLGDSEYREAIEAVLECATHLIVFASKPEYFNSKWVKYEWGLFLNAKIDGFKDGNILNILSGLNPKDVPFALRPYESFQYPAYRDSILTYVETEASKLRIKEANEKIARENELRRREDEKRKRHEKIKAELIHLAEEYKKCESGLDVLTAKIRARKKSLGITHYICPVCHTGSSIDADYCGKCGWIFFPIEGVDGAEYLLADKQGAISRHWQIFNKGSHSSGNSEAVKDLMAQVSSLKKENSQLMLELEKMKEQLKACGKKSFSKEFVTVSTSQPPFSGSPCDPLATFGIKIYNCGKNKRSVIKILADEYGTTEESFKELLDCVPTQTQPNLTRVRANDLLIRLWRIGADVKIYDVWHPNN